MADTLPGILWHLEGSPRAFLPCEFFTEQGAALLELLIGLAGVREQFDAAFEKTTPRWWGLWVHSPLTPEQCLLLYKVFEQLEYADYHRRVQHWTFLRALRLGTKRPLHAELSRPGHCDFGIRDVFCHCPYCRNCWRLQGGEAIECSACGCVFFPEQTRWSEPDTEPTERYSHEFLAFWERARGYFLPHTTPRGHLGYQQEYFWFDVWRVLRWRLWWYDPGWTYRLRRSKLPRGIEYLRSNDHVPDL
ncbi:hypothetical protein [Armatimonas rosea]|uniref:Uncharacterized protein n=1 Tax=Armatimonas rosea TaxID=685828 RepID=A0A7W9W8U9_ARMRO|nr:hypothetical protein [Armatimonas rosea]MBB6052636.1 hypothetical protein [Armatimonas rosea]